MPRDRAVSFPPISYPTRTLRGEGNAAILANDRVVPFFRPYPLFSQLDDGVNNNTPLFLPHLARV